MPLKTSDALCYATTLGKNFAVVDSVLCTISVVLLIRSQQILSIQAFVTCRTRDCSLIYVLRLLSFIVYYATKAVVQ